MIKSFGNYILVYEVEATNKNRLMLDNCVGIKKVKIFSIPKNVSELWTKEGSTLNAGTILYIKDTKNFDKYISINGQKMIPILTEDIVAFEMEDK